MQLTLQDHDSHLVTALQDCSQSLKEFCLQGGGYKDVINNFLDTRESLKHSIAAPAPFITAGIQAHGGLLIMVMLTWY